jgi:hypothetical protein
VTPADLINEAVTAILKFPDRGRALREVMRLRSVLRSFKREHHSGCNGQGVAGMKSCTCGAWDFNERIERMIRGE